MPSRLQEDDLTQSFVTESRDMIDEAEPHLIALSNSENFDEDINIIFRLFHSIKGSSSFLKFKNLTKVTHEAETLLQRIRDGIDPLNQQHIEIFIQGIDVVRAILADIESVGSDSAFASRVEELTNIISASYLKENQPSSQKQVSQPSSQKQVSQPSSQQQVSQPSSQQTSSENSLQEKSLLDLDTSLTIKRKNIITPEIHSLFMQEACDFLDKAEEIFVELEKNPDDAMNSIGEVFRLIHSFKGNCGVLNFKDMERLSHTIESVLSAIHSKKIAMNDDHIVTFLNMVDIFKHSIEDIGKGGSGNIQGIDIMDNLLKEMLPQDSAKKNDLTPQTSEKKQDTQKKNSIVESSSKIAQKNLPFTQNATNTDLTQKQILENNLTKQRLQSMTETRTVIKRGDIRVDLAKLDTLINLVGELVIAESMVTKNPDLEGHEFENFDRSARHLNRIVRDLQDICMSVRMIPISATFKKMNRLVYDVAARANKKAKLIIEGESTEVDKTVAELIHDPLVHMIRNAIDHGIESPDIRLKSNKDETGTVKLEARHESGEIWILVEDDGAGLNREKIIAKAVQQGLLTEDACHMISDDDVFKLIFEPGFSTAEKVTDISGRGVGMDVVKKNIEQLKGRVVIRSQKGKGTTMIIRIPLTLSIIDGMLVRVGNVRYTIPLLSIRESIQITSDNIVTTMDGQEVVKLRDELFPVLRLHELFKLKPDHIDLYKGLLIVIQQHTGIIGLFVDEILGQHQAVIKGLSKYIFTIREVRGISGCTILGDGSISLILDVGSLIDIAQTKFQAIQDSVSLDIK